MKKVLLFFYFISLIALSPLWAQQSSVSGKVTSAEDGSALPGVNVIIEGSTIGTTTNVDGNYRLNVPEAGGTLIFSFIGLVTEEIQNQWPIYCKFDYEQRFEATTGSGCGRIWYPGKTRCHRFCGKRIRGRDQ